MLLALCLFLFFVHLLGHGLLFRVIHLGFHLLRDPVFRLRRVASGGVLMRYVVPCALALGPMFFAGVIFARSFRVRSGETASQLDPSSVVRKRTFAAA